MTTPVTFTLQATKDTARAGEIVTPHGSIQTPKFMPVGTRAAVKSLTSSQVENLSADIILANTYHLLQRPGLDILEKSGGIHNFMRWQRPILTDSGGFQVFSLGLQAEQQGSASQVQIQEGGVAFKSAYDGSDLFMGPAEAFQAQRSIGADIIMAFDECAPDTADYEYHRQAWERTYRWAKQAFKLWEEADRQSRYGSYQALIGIIQGGLHQNLRREAAQAIAEISPDGIALGGESIGYNMEATVEIMGWIRDLLPEKRFRYAMGLGRDPQNIIDAVLAGYDIFDCVAPTRMARNGSLYSGELVITQSQTKLQAEYQSEFPQGRLSISQARFKDDQAVLDDSCDCPTCIQGYSRAYLHHLFNVRELSYYSLASQHNLRTMIRLTQQLRTAILA